MKIREIYTVVRESETEDWETIDDIKNYCLFISDETGEFLYGGTEDDELSVKFQIDKGNGWEDFDPEK